MSDERERAALDDSSETTRAELDPERRPRRRPDAQLLLKTGRIVISDDSGDGAVVATLNESAAAVWELCDGTTTVGEIVSAICDLSSIAPSRARRDVERTLAALEEAGLMLAPPRSSSREAREGPAER